MAKLGEMGGLEGRDGCQSWEMGAKLGEMGGYVGEIVI